jgi:enamine deaminase RidA (YjgF/YER057c/UK114 family)
MERQNVSAVSPYADVFGFSRAVRANEHVFVAGCAAIGSDGRNVGIGDAAAQARRCFEVIELALGKAGASLADVVLTRVFLVDAAHADAVARVHGEVFNTIRPVTSAVLVAGLLDPDWLVEIEAHAVIGARLSAPT